jgi:hypothetical protein
MGGVLGMEKGIHGNEGCNSCGACCVLPSISVSGCMAESEFKRAGEICEFLEYDGETNKTSCTCYGEVWRPEACKGFFCSLEGFGERRESAKNDLKDVADNMPEIIAVGKPIRIR